MEKFAVLYRLVQAGELKNFRAEIWAANYPGAVEKVTNDLSNSEFIHASMIGDEHGVLIRTSTILNVQISAYVIATSI